jgi:hypothetical protein
MRSMPMPRRNHQTESLERPNKALALAKGVPLSVRMALGRPKSLKTRSNTLKAYCPLVLESASQLNR